MTDQNNAAQPVLTDDEIRDIITDAHQAYGAFKTGYGLALGRAIESALLSKLRAEGVQAGDERAAFEAHMKEKFGGLVEPWDARRGRYGFGPDNTRWEGWHDRAALASAPVADTIQWPIMPASKGQSPVLFEDGYAEGWAKCMDECRRAVSAASAPVAGEAQPSDDELKRFARSLPARPWGIGSRQCDALAFARALLSRYAAPQASEAAGQWRDLALKFDAQRMVFRGLLKAAVPLLIGPEDFKQQIEKALASSPAECLKTQADKDGGDCAKGAGDERAEFEAWAVGILGDNPTWRESAPCELAWQAWQARAGTTPSVVKQSLTATQTGEKGEKDA